MNARQAELLHERFQSFWQSPTGWRGATAVNHTTIGRRYLVTGFTFFIIGGLLAMAIRAQLAWFDNTDLDHATYNQFVTMHGTTMMFLFAVPILEGLAIYLVPKMIGARDLPFPRLSAFGYFCYLFGGIFLYTSFLFGAAPDGGWFMYPPLTTRDFSPGAGADFWLLGVTFIEVAALAAAVEVIVSILKTRAPGMTLARMPLFAWYMLVTSFMILLGFPPLILGSVLLEIERSFGFVFFDTSRGGDPLLWQHLFWLFGHPEVYIIFLPAAGVVTMVVETFSRRPLVGYGWVVAAVIATGFLSFGLWVHHMFATGIPRLSLSFFSAASMAVAIPSGIQVFCWIATLWAGRPVLSLPLLYVFGMLFIFVLGGLTGVMVALVPFDWQVHDSHFVVAHLHYVLIGGMMFPLFAGIYYWLPLFIGRRASDTLGRIGFYTLFAGFNITFLPMHLTGMLGMPRRVYTYAEGFGWEWLNLLSTVGSFVMTIGVALFLTDLYLHARYGAAGGRNPWGAASLEWGMRLPAPAFNFVSIPPVGGRHPLWERPELAGESAEGRHFLGDPSSGYRETLGTTLDGAEPEQVIRLPKPSWLPFWSAAAGALPLIGVLTQLYWLAVTGLVALVVLLLVWAAAPAYGGAPARIEASPGLRLPNQAESGQGPGLWGSGLTLLGSSAIFASLLFAYAFLWTVSPAWPASGYAGSTGGEAFAGALLLAGAALGVYLAGTALRKGRAVQFRVAVAVACVLAVIFLLVTGDWLAGLPPRGTHAYSSLLHVLYGYQLLHFAVALMMGGFVVWRSRIGLIDAARTLEPAVAALWWYYAVAVGFVVLVVFFLLPRLL